MTDEIYQGIADNTAKIGSLGYGFTSGGNPVSTAVALENIRILEERGLIPRVNEIGPHLQQRLRRLSGHPLVGEVRGVGLAAGVELIDRATGRPFDPVGRIGAQVQRRCQEHGLLIRAIGDTIAFCPPLIIDERQIDEMVDRFSRVHDETMADVAMTGGRS